MEPAGSPYPPGSSSASTAAARGARTARCARPAGGSPGRRGAAGGAGATRVAASTPCRAASWVVERGSPGLRGAAPTRVSAVARRRAACRATHGGRSARPRARRQRARRRGLITLVIHFVRQRSIRSGRRDEVALAPYRDRHDSTPSRLSAVPWHGVPAGDVSPGQSLGLHESPHDIDGLRSL